MSDKVLQFNKGSDSLYAMAERAQDGGDHYSCVMYLQRILKEKPDDFDALLMLAKEYNAVEEYRMGKQILFRMLPKYASNAEVNYCLSMSLAAEGDVYGAENYLKRIGDVEQLPGETRSYISETFDSVFKFGDDDNDGFRMVKPRSEKFYMDKINLAEDFMRDGDFRAAVRILKGIECGESCYEMAAELLLMCYSSLGNNDAAVVVAEEVLRSYPDNLPVLCSYYTLLKLQERHEEAAKIIKKLESLTFPNDFSLIAKGIQAFVTAGAHDKVLELVNIRLKDRPFEPHAWTLKAIALYNAGLKEESRRQFVRMATFYPEMTAAESYLSYLAEKPKEIAYSLGEPFGEFVLKTAMVNRLLALNKREFEDVLEQNLPLVKWAIRKLDDKVVFKLLVKLAKSYDEKVYGLFSELLTDVNVDIGYKHEMLYHLAKIDEKRKLNVVAENVFRTVQFKHADFSDFPRVLKEAYYVSAAELAILYPDNDGYQQDLNRLTNLIKKDDIPCGDKMLFNKEKSVKTLSAVFNYIAEARTDTDFNKNQFFEEYKVDKNLFEQYLAMIYNKWR